MPAIDAFAKEVAPIPVVLTLAAVAIKDAFEDFCRHLSDRRVNRRICKVFSMFQLYHTVIKNEYILHFSLTVAPFILSSEKKCYVDEQWQHIRPGDFIRLHTNEMIPADVLLLHSSNVAGICHIETANLDGESNLKQREVVERHTCKQQFSPLNFIFPAEVEAPSAELYKFSGKIIRPDGFIPIRKHNVILRGCVLRNTDYVEGMVVYAGSGVWQQNLPGDDVLFVALDRNASTSTPAFQGFLNFWRFIIIFQVSSPTRMMAFLLLCCYRKSELNETEVKFPKGAGYFRKLCFFVMYSGDFSLFVSSNSNL
ncbi:Phospholipid-transporting ATPase [Fasciola gigantica]|uniref:Phospholipid-transporting ATPase n=1 Tax=Fasciola gigantica TaxID=46835 RepID=A0A504YWG3_FASGI|nr:Phospholipid-transporting ATPase [Fasciola gigantica]